MCIDFNKKNMLLAIDDKLLTGNPSPGPIFSHASSSKLHPCDLVGHNFEPV